MESGSQGSPAADRSAAPTAIPAAVVVAVVLAATGLTAPPPAAAMLPRDLLEIQVAGIGALSPDGRLLIFTHGIYDLETRAMRTSVFLRDLDTGDETQLFAPDDGAENFAWRPDGQSVAYTVPAGDSGHEVWLMDATGGDRWPISAAGDFGPLTWSPDGTAIAHVVREQAEPYGGVTGRIVVADDLGYRHLGDGYREGKLGQLHLLDVVTGEDRALPTPLLDVRELAWAPDGNRLVICGQREADLGRNLNTDLFVLDRAGGPARRLTSNPGPDEDPIWLPDRTIACRSHAEPLHESEPARIVILSARTGRELSRQASEFDDLMLSLVYHDGAFYFRGCHRGSVDVFRATPTAGERLTPGGYDFWDLRLGGGRAVLQGAGMTLPGALFTLDLATGALQLVFDPNERWRQRVNLVEPQAFRIEVEGREIEGWAFLPAHREPGQRLPTVLSLHGGPEWMYGGYFLAEFHVLPAFGYAVICVNPTGSTGYGRSFQDDVRGDWVGRPAREVLACLDWAVAQGWADPEALAVMGGSYGGHLAAALTTQTRTFKAAACDRMFPSLTAFWGTTDEKWFPEWEFFGRPWEPQAAEFYRRNDPFFDVAAVTTPTLLSHGALDYRCLAAGSEMWFSALQSLGVPSRLLRFEDEGHGLRGRENQVFYLEQVLAWFDAHVLPHGTEDE
jgi:dipeptidyl aminopeptidase/acylaminoacyl peptidase